MNVNYITDNDGKQSAVIVPIGEWENFVKKYNKIKNKLAILTGLQNAVEEVKLIQTGKKKGKTLREFLDEN